MLQVFFDGNLGRDAEYKETQSGKPRCSFAVASTTGYGDNKVTHWIDVTRWGDGAKGLANILVKGSKVSVLGELTTREHNGKTYLQCRASEISILSTPQAGERKQPYDDGRENVQHFSKPPVDDLDDDLVPF